MLIALVVIVGFGSVFALLTNPRFFAAEATLTVTQPVCGTWQSVSGSIFGQKIPKLYGLAGTSDNDIWGIGTESAAHHWDGAKWSEVSLPRPAGSTGIELRAIEALGSNDIWVVGQQVGAAPEKQTLTYHWDGSQWTHISSPNVAQANNALNSVTGSASDSVWAVGSYEVGQISSSLVMRWDGAQWTIVPHTDNCGGEQAFYGSMALAGDDVWAVGSCAEGTTNAISDTVRTMTQHWDGSGWNVVPSPNHAPQSGINSSDLNEIHGTGPNDLWAVGSYWASSGNAYWTQPMIQHWTGEEWTEVSFTHPGTGTTTNLLDVFATAPDDAWAIGLVNSSQLTPLTLHWDGTAWAEVETSIPLAEGYYSSLYADGDSLMTSGPGFDNEDGASYGIMGQFERKSCSDPVATPVP